MKYISSLTECDIGLLFDLYNSFFVYKGQSVSQEVREKCLFHRKIGAVTSWLWVEFTFADQQRDLPTQSKSVQNSRCIAAYRLWTVTGLGQDWKWISSLGGAVAVFVLGLQAPYLGNASGVNPEFHPLWYKTAHSRVCKAEGQQPQPPPLKPAVGPTTKARGRLFLCGGPACCFRLRAYCLQLKVLGNVLECGIFGELLLSMRYQKIGK